AMKPLLDELGLSIPRSNARALWRILYGRVYRFFAGEPKMRVHTPTPRELVRVDVLGSLSWAVVLLDQLAGYALQMQHLRLAMRTGDPKRAAMAMGLEAAVRSMNGTRRGDEAGRALEAAQQIIG